LNTAQFYSRIYGIGNEQVGLLKKEGDRQRLVREDMESELQVLKRQNATLTEASSTREGGVRRESNSERFV